LTAALRLDGLGKSVPGARLLFDGLQLSVAPGEHVAIRGESRRQVALC
jgi:ABC-type transport system involved in cytochrome bd biosynthesis fused ATPase/permease subunit